MNNFDTHWPSKNSSLHGLIFMILGGVKPLASPLSLWLKWCKDSDNSIPKPGQLYCRERVAPGGRMIELNPRHNHVKWINNNYMWHVLWWETDCNLMRNTLDTYLNQNHFILLLMYRIYLIRQKSNGNKKVVCKRYKQHETQVSNRMEQQISHPSISQTKA
jgi:hypothetical protein